jgi:ribosome-binding protein aMBF1 (putative translation factor)
MPVMTKSPKGDDIVILSRREYERLVLAANEDAADAVAARKAVARNEETLSEAELDALLAAKTPLAFWRRKRGLTQAELAKSVGIAQGFLSELEAGQKTGTVGALRRIASVLGISLDDITSSKDRSFEQRTKRPARRTIGRRSANR